MGVDHVVQRARERYGLELRPTDVSYLKGAILGGGSVKVETKPNGAEVHLVMLPWLERVVKAVWRPDIGLVVTVLPAKSKCYREPIGPEGRKWKANFKDPARFRRKKQKK